MPQLSVQHSPMSQLQHCHCFNLFTLPLSEQDFGIGPLIVYPPHGQFVLVIVVIVVFCAIIATCSPICFFPLGHFMCVEWSMEVEVTTTTNYDSPHATILTLKQFCANSNSNSTTIFTCNNKNFARTTPTT